MPKRNSSLVQAFDKLDALAENLASMPAIDVEVERILICSPFERADVVSLVKWWERANAVLAARGLPR